MRAFATVLLLAAGNLGIGSASDDASGVDGRRVYDPATGGLITLEGERNQTPRLSEYLEGLKTPIKTQWEPLVTSLQGERKIPKCYTGVRGTILAIALDAKGNAKGLELSRASGVDALDEIAMLAVRRAQPLPPPPPDVLDETGVVRFWFGFYARGGGKWRDPRELRSDPDVPVYANSCVTPPVALEARCIGDGVQLPADYAGQTPGSVSIKFAVMKDGVPGEVEILTSGTPAEVQDAIKTAVSRCRWSPGLNETWAPTAMWVVMPVRFVRPDDGGVSPKLPNTASPEAPPRG